MVAHDEKAVHRPRQREFGLDHWMIAVGGVNAQELGAGNRDDALAMDCRASRLKGVLDDPARLERVALQINQLNGLDVVVRAAAGKWNQDQAGFG